ncbi:uncharacterized protein LOC135348780 isoform X2 [Halichondria panicea]|uniref:uncharacterized protein LOC135348780 isoform X2 n=1 Tax=Halichondria panicea TaxID=6063 RepID=UPI00312B5255
MFTGNANASDDQFPFICEQTTFHRLCTSLYSQKGHVLRIEFLCDTSGRRQWWASSRTQGGRYIVNQKIVHAFTCAGILPSQCIHFSGNAAGLGKVGARYITSRGHVDACAKSSMLNAIEEVNATLDNKENVFLAIIVFETSVLYQQWVITDAPHDSTANEYNITVPCLSRSAKRIVGCSNGSNTEHNCAPTRKVACTKIVFPRTLEKGLNVVEVKHDNQPVVKKYVADDLNSYNTWNGTKNVAKKMAKIAVGTKKGRGKTWFPELSDKRKAKRLQDEHEDCDKSSLFKHLGDSPTKIKLEDPAAIEACKAGLKDTLICRNAPFYCQCRDTFWVESFNHQLLAHIPKRVHFGSSTFEMRMNRTIMDWEDGHVTCTCDCGTEQKRLKRSQLRILKLQNAQMFLSITLSELIALLKTLHSKWSLPMDLVFRMINSKFWVMEADVWADLLYICRWANPSIFKEDVFCALCKSAWKQPIASKCAHLFCCTCIIEGIKNNLCCPHKKCSMKLSVTLPPREEYAAETLVRKYEEQCRDKNLKELISISKKMADDSNGDYEATTSQDTNVLCRKRNRDDTGATPVTPASKRPDIQPVKETDLLRFLEQLYPAKDKWFNLGLCLGLPCVDLESIENKRPDDGDRLRDILRIRLKSSNISHEELLKALRSQSVGHDELAAELDSMF